MHGSSAASEGTARDIVSLSDQKALLGSVYSTADCSIHTALLPPQPTFFSDSQDSGTGSISTTSSTSTGTGSGSGSSATSNGAPAHGLDHSLCSQSTPTSDPAVPPVTVIISGIYMGINPCPGVGMARALRAHFGPGGVRLVAVDDCQFSDPVFDAYLPVEETMTGASEAAEQWAAVEKVLQRERSSGAQVFYLPVR
jgi:hypothetical protein